MDLGRDLRWAKTGPLLVVGNPPWVTNAQLSRLASSNRPERRNIKGLPGLEAMTGSSNFDIAEYIWLKLIVELQADDPTVAHLCKTSVARNVLQYCADFQLPVASASLYRIDAKKWFGVNVDACLFVVSIRRPSRFCVFGVGDYSFAPYKVAISGLHKIPRFQVVGLSGTKPVVFDDTCYFLSFERRLDALLVGALLQSQAAGDFLPRLSSGTPSGRSPRACSSGSTLPALPTQSIPMRFSSWRGRT